MTKLMTLVLTALCCLGWAADDAAVQKATSFKLQAPGYETDAIAIPKMLSYQGRLTDNAGSPVRDSTYSVTFRLYTVPSGGSSFWNETQSVTTKSGLFTVLLGSVTPISSVSEAGALYLGMQVGASELTPRLRLVSAAYSYYSDDALKLAGKTLDSLDARYRRTTGNDSITGSLAVSGEVRGHGRGMFGYQCGFPGTSTFVAGQLDTAAGGYSAVGGGYLNVARSTYSVVCGGTQNQASGNSAVVSGGEGNVTYGLRSAIGGGSYNQAGDAAADTGAFVGGGYSNRVMDKYGTIAGGYDNEAQAKYSVVGGGYINRVLAASDSFGTIAGGRENQVQDVYGTIGGGRGNYANWEYATVCGGINNTVGNMGYAGTVAGGQSNSVTAGHGAVAGGNGCNVAGDYGFAAGNNSDVTSGHTNSAAFNGTATTASSQLRCGTLSKAGGSFTIDHPLDPYGKILNHYFVESPDMSNVYSGSVALDAGGRAEVRLPDYFDALNRNARVQLTGVGTREVVYVAEDVAGNRFAVGGPAGAKVYWQVTGDRKDVSAEAIRRMMPVEQPKTGELADRMLDDDFLSGCMGQLEREGKAAGIDFRTSAGRLRYEQMKQMTGKQ